jgi:UDP:flavonoid glycosyltransferase YjiC (YdhE family)
MRILFVGEAVSLAHITRPLMLARSLKGQVHEIILAWGDEFAPFVSCDSFKRMNLFSVS